MEQVDGMDRGKVPVGKVINSTLKVIGFGTILVTGLFAPNAIQILELFEGGKKRRPLETDEAYEREAKRALREMRRQKLVEFHDNPARGKQIKLTRKGLKRLKRVQLQDLAIERPAQWDNRWRLVIFDIPRQHQAGRLALLGHLRRLEFYQLKQSVWVHPFPCETAVRQLVDELGLQKYSLVATSSFTPEVEAALTRHYKKLPV